MESVADLRNTCVKKSTNYVTGMARCDNVLWVDGSVELKAKLNSRRIS